jgi:glucose uptake protein
MFIIATYPAAVFCCIITMLCWGSWANTQKLAANSWRFELFYWDYVLGILLFSLLLAFTLGSTGAGGRPFLADISQAGGRNIASAILGGIIFNAANILLCAAIAIAGMAVAFPVGIGLALVIGVLVNYIANPIGNKGLLASGVIFIVIAILLNAFAYRRLQAAGKRTSAKGLFLALTAGILMGFFYEYVAASMFPDFNAPEPGKLSPYTAVFIFSIGILLSNSVFNTLLMKRPFAGPPASYRALLGGSARNHATGILGGSIWCLGMSLSIIAAGKAGPAISYGLGQGATIIAALWGIFVWKEFKAAPKGTGAILTIMLLFYLIGLGLLVGAGA